MPDPFNETPSRLDLRAELEDMVVRDLLGPAGGPHEEIAEPKVKVRDRYLVGVLAPANRSDPWEGYEEGGQYVADGEEQEDMDAPALPDPLAEGGADSSEDGTTDLDVPVQQACFPSSFSMTFSVDDAVDEIQIEANWGQYRKEIGTTTDPNTGKALQVWKRHPRGGKTLLRLNEGMQGPLVADSEMPEVYVQAEVRKRDGFRVVTLFLVNGQSESRPKDAKYIFQPELIARGTDGKAVFVRGLRSGMPAAADSATQIEEKTLDMMYRRRQEFAVGHGVSAGPKPKEARRWHEQRQISRTV